MSAAPFVLPSNPKANYLAHREELDAAVRQVLDSGWYILGQEVSGFEAEFAAYLGVKHALGVGSGTEAIHLALRTLGIGPGDAVLTVSHTAVATVAAIELAGATPVLADIDPATFTMDVESLEAAIKAHGHRRLKAIVVVHLYGHPANMPAILEVAGRRGLFVIEDCAQAHGASIGATKTGGWGHVAAFSFYPTKNLGALGDGGAVVTNDPVLTEKARLLRQYGWRERYISELAGTNTRLDELQAAILRVKLRHLEAENARRRQLAAVYDAGLASTPLELPRCARTVTHVYHQYTVRSPRRDELAAYLKSKGIGTAVLYPQPVHLQPAYRDRLSLAPGGLAVTEGVCRQLLCLPMHPQLEDEQARRIAGEIVRWHASGADERQDG